MANMKRVILTAVAVGIVACAPTLFATESTLKELVQHFKNSGMPLDAVEYQTLTNDQKKIGVVEGINVEDDARRRLQISKVIYMFTVLRQADQDSMNSLLQFGRAFKNEDYTNGLFLLTFPKNPPLNAAIKEKIVTIFRSFRTDGSAITGSGGPQPLLLSNSSLRRLIIKTFIDGKSVLKVQGNKLWWEHQKDSLPGKWDGRNEPTAINDQNWLPKWEGNKSQPFVCTSPFIPSIAREVRLHKIKARGIATVLEQPTANNANTLVVLFDDSKPTGADWYTIELYW